MKRLTYRLKKTIAFRLFHYIKNPKRRRSFRAMFPSDPVARRRSLVAWLLFGMGAKDFYRLQCDKMSFKEIRSRVSFHECSLYYETVNSPAAGRILGDKYRAYQRFSDLYQRDVAYISAADIASGGVMEKISDFAALGHKQIVVKPQRMNRGRGVGVYEDLDAIKELLTSSGGGVLEALIVQDEALAAFNTSSVNTLRINTVNYGDGEVEVLWPCLRMGHAGSFVDNAGSGGIFAAIDPLTGDIIGAADEKRHIFTEHPDSHKALSGYCIPQWKKACEMARQAASALPEATFVGWDLALTKDGWVLVEGNHTPLIIWQIASRQGIREQFRKIEKRTIFERKK